MNNTIHEDTTKRHSKKYKNKNFIHQLVLGRFLDEIANELKFFQEKRVLDFGCGEAFFWDEMLKREVSMQCLTGIDLREDALIEAKKKFPQHQFFDNDLLTFQPNHKYEVVIASQVLEHLYEPRLYLKQLINLSSLYVLITVPWEPYFRLSNFVRGRDLLRFGNHPEHINLWGKRAFRNFIKSEMKIIKYITIFPFLLCIGQVNKQ